MTYEETKNALTNEAQEVLGISAFHLAFTTDDEAQIPSDIDYQVQIDYKDAVLAAAEGQEDSSVGAYVNQAGATADIQTSENGAVEAVLLSTKELGDVAVVITGAVAEAKTVYTYEDANVIVTATIEKADAVPDDAKFVVTELNEEEHKADYEATEEELQKYAEEQQIGYTGYVIYDMHFEDAEGNEIEPEEGSVKVAVEYKSAKEISDDVNDTDSKVSVLHLDESQGNVNVEDITQDVEVNKKGEIEGAQFETVNFSTFVLARMVNTMDINVEAPDGTYYLAITDNSSNWLNVKSKVQEVVVSGGKTQITVPLNDNNGIGDKYEAVVLGLKDGKNYSENYDQNNYVVYKSGSYLNKNTGSYKISVTSKQGNSQTLKIEEVGTQATSMNGIINSIGNAANFMVVANSFIQHDHYEGNIAVTDFEPNGKPIGVNGTETKLNLTITVTKTVVPAESKSFKFGIYDAKGTLVKELQIVTDEYGKGIGSYTINDAKNSYKVYELNEKNEKLEDGATNGSYKVSYISSEGLDNIVANYGTSSFAKNVIGNKNLTANKDTVLYTTTDGVTMQNGEVEKVSSEEFDSMVDIPGMLTNIGTLSSNLANTKTSGNVVVYNLNVDELPIENGGHLKLPGIGSDQALVINVVIPNGTTEYHLGKDLNSFDVGNESLKISGYQTAANAALANRTVWNFVYENGSAYTGTVYQETTLGGTFLVPNGTIYAANSTPVALYAQTVNQYQGYSELHKGGFHTDVNKDANVSVKNEKKAALKIVKNVTVNDKATTSTLADGTYYFKIKKKDDPSFNAIHKSITIKNGESGKVEIEELEAGTYIVSEDTDKNPSGISLIGENDIEVVVTAKNKGEIPTATFTNNTISTNIGLEAKKVLKGRDLTDGEFTFGLYDGDKKVAEATNDAEGNIKFADDAIQISLSDMKDGDGYAASKQFIYTMTEKKGTAGDGVTYDPEEKQVTVNAVYDKASGKLSLILDNNSKYITFTNTYYEEGSANLKATKDFSGTTWKDETFQFVLTAGKAEGSEAASPMPEGTVDGSKTVTVTKDSKTAEFGTIVYVNNGTYNYQIHEVNDEQAGITYDGIVWNVRVIVSNGQNGVKNVAIQYKKSTDETYTQWNDANDAFAVTFHNTYVEKGTARIQVAKEFNADEYPTGDDAFTFTLKAAQNEEGTTESPLPKQTTVKVTDANAVSFGDITFDTNGTYNYTVEENAGMLSNVIYDKTVYDVQIKVEDGGKADGVKKITVMSKKQADKEYAPLDGTVFTAAFSNTRYAVNVKKTDLTGVNEVKGATITVYKASDINEDGTVKENAEKITAFESNGGANDISEKLIRGEAYVLVETSAPEGYAFTNNIPFTLNEDGTVTVDKELQAEDGTILVKDALIGEQKVPLAATKTLTGAALTGDDFSFTLEEVKEDGTTELLQTKTNDAAGKVAFDDLTYDYKAEGKTFTYVVKETDTQKTGITYSKEAYTVKVVISRADTEGKMTAEVSYTDAAGKAADAMNFTNTFAGSVSLVKVGPQQQKLAGAKFMLYQQQPSTDYKAYAETEYVTDANGNIKVDGLPEGNYYFVETTAPDGYVIKMNDDGTAKQYPFTIQAGKAEATVGVDIDLGLIENDTITPGEGGDIDLGSVTIEKSVLNAAGKTITADGTTFYAGVFTKNQDGTYTLVKSATLEQNGKVTIKDLTVGTYYLFETTKQGDRINEADFAFEITGNGQEFQIKSDENTDVKLVNKEKETVESEEETEKESEVETETKTKKTTTVKTGDTTPIALYVGLLAAAAVLIALIVFLRKRKNK